MPTGDDDDVVVIKKAKVNKQHLADAIAAMPDGETKAELQRVHDELPD